MVSITSTADEYVSDLMKTPSRILVLFLDEASFLDPETCRGLKETVSLSQKAFNSLSFSERVSAVKWLREMSGLLEGGQDA